jgi:hypothetical protein
MPIKCQDRECEADATHCISWRTPSMSACSFWYHCAEHMKLHVDSLGEAVRDVRRLPSGTLGDTKGAR